MFWPFLTRCAQRFRPKRWSICERHFHENLVVAQPSCWLSTPATSYDEIRLGTWLVSAAGFRFKT